MQKIQKHTDNEGVTGYGTAVMKSVRKTEQGRFPMRSFLLLYSRQEPEGDKVMDLAVQLLNLNPSCPGLEGIMGLELADFQKIRGIGRVKAVQLAAVCELSRRMSRIQFSESYAFTTPQSIADYYMAYMCRLGHEEVHVMMLDTKQHMISECLLTKGTVNASLIAPREIFIQALKAGAVSIVLVHNHPSGDPTPSREDMLTTKRILDAGALIGIELLDHIIIGNNCYISFREEGIL